MMSNINPMCDGTSGNKGVVDPNDLMRATDEQVRALVWWIVNEYNHFEIDEMDDDEFNKYFEDYVADLKAHPHDVGFLFTTFDDEDDDGNYIDEHEIQISMDLCRMVWMVFVDSILIHEEEIIEEDFDLDSASFQYVYEYFMRDARDFMDEHRDELMYLETSPDCTAEEEKRFIEAIESAARYQG